MRSWGISALRAGFEQGLSLRACCGTALLGSPGAAGVSICLPLLDLVHLRVDVHTGGGPREGPCSVHAVAGSQRVFPQPLTTPHPLLPPCNVHQGRERDQPAPELPDPWGIAFPQQTGRAFVASTLQALWLREVEELAQAARRSVAAP